jgi:WD repeat-containing protein 48
MQIVQGFINAEVKVRARDAEAASPSPPSNHPTFISLSELDRSPPLPSSSMPRTPGMTIALATPALSRAVLPDLPNIVTDLPRNGLFESAPSTDRSLSSMPESPTGTVGTRTPIARTGGDYFSLPPSVTSTPDLALSPSIAPKSPEVVGSPTPGGTLMGRLRLLGKGSKRPTTGDPDATLPAVTATVTAPEIVSPPHHILSVILMLGGTDPNNRGAATAPNPHRRLLKAHHAVSPLRGASPTLPDQHGHHHF